MRVVISVPGTFHAALLANALHGQSAEVEIWTTVLRRHLRGLADGVELRLFPSPAALTERLTPLRLPRWINYPDSIVFDAGVAALMPQADLFIGWATKCLYAARKAKRAGSLFALDRACPHRDSQEALAERESERVGARYQPQPEWFRERQLEEYALADAILVPSAYTARTFPEALRGKLVKAPLFGRCTIPETIRTERNTTFTVGVVGGNPLRKGYLYLLLAWKKLALPNARLLLRSRDFAGYPVLDELARSLTNVEFLSYVPNISDFYQRCDVVVLPSVDDGFGMALIEGMANGRASIATTNCGAAELMSDGQDGLVVPPADEDALAAGLLRLYESEELRRLLGAAARMRAREVLEARLYDRAIAGLLARVGEGEAAAVAS